MQLVNVRLAAAGGTSAAPEWFRDLLYRSAMPGDLLEHVYAESRFRALDLALFLTHPSPAEALDAAVRICRRCLRADPALEGWHLDRYALAAPPTTWQGPATAGP